MSGGPIPACTDRMKPRSAERMRAGAASARPAPPAVPSSRGPSPGARSRCRTGLFDLDRAHLLVFQDRMGAFEEDLEAARRRPRLDPVPDAQKGREGPARVLERHRCHVLDPRVPSMVLGPRDDRDDGPEHPGEHVDVVDRVLEKRPSACDRTSARQSDPYIPPTGKYWSSRSTAAIGEPERSGSGPPSTVSPRQSDAIDANGGEDLSTRPTWFARPDPSTRLEIVSAPSEIPGERLLAIDGHPVRHASLHHSAWIAVGVHTHAASTSCQRLVDIGGRHSLAMGSSMRLAFRCPRHMWRRPRRRRGRPDDGTHRERMDGSDEPAADDGNPCRSRP